MEWKDYLKKNYKGTEWVFYYIVDSNGNKKKIIVSTIVENGKDIKLTIDSNLQKNYMNNLKMIRAVQLL